MSHLLSLAPAPQLTGMGQTYIFQALVYGMKSEGVIITVLAVEL